MKCRFCKHYYFEGRRQGFCLLLSAPVQGSAPMCCLAIPPFAVNGEGPCGCVAKKQPLLEHKGA